MIIIIVCFSLAVAIVGLERSSYLTSEDSTAVEVCILASCCVRFEDKLIEVKLSTRDLAASGLYCYEYNPFHNNFIIVVIAYSSALSDYLNTTQQIEFQGGKVCTNISINDDSIPEREEQFLLTLSSSDPQVQFHQSSVTVIIIDNDGKAFLYKHCCIFLVTGYGNFHS